MESSTCECISRWVSAPVSQRGFAVVNVRNDAEIADVLGIHGSLCECAAPPSALHALRAGDAPFKPSSLPHKGGKSKLERGVGEAARA
jgi:hypothetical protein